MDKCRTYFLLRVGTGVGYARWINAEYISYSGLVLEQGTLDEPMQNIFPTQDWYWSRVR